MGFTNYHCHSDHCDCHGCPSTYVEAVITQGLDALGFSYRAALPFVASRCLGRGEDPSACSRYRNEIDDLRRIHAECIDIRCGLEWTGYQA